MVTLAAARPPMAVRLKESQTFRESAKVPIKISAPPTQSDPYQNGSPPSPLRMARTSRRYQKG
jgi:hypothetical protein